MRCRHCYEAISLTMLDLGSAPPSNSYVSQDPADMPEASFPLKVVVCERCWLVQTEEAVERELMFSDSYAYFSGVSEFWQGHVEAFTHAAIKSFGLSKESFVVEIASNDGTLLEVFANNGLSCLGVEPTLSTASVAIAKGLNTETDFFGASMAANLVRKHRPADLVVANNVLAHVPDINDFVKGIKTILAPGGVISVEFPHLLNLLRETQYDTVYHEHYAYLSLGAVKRIFEKFGLKVFRVQKILTHGGSLRVFGAHADASYSEEASIGALIQEERMFGLELSETYFGFQQRAEEARDVFRSLLVSERDAGRLVVGFGAAAKGNTCLNYARIDSSLMPFVFDSSPSKQGKLLPGSRIPVRAPSELFDLRPDVIVVLAWNLANEIVPYLRQNLPDTTRYLVASPELKFL